MNKLSAGLTVATFLISASTVLAQSPIPVNVSSPGYGIDPATTIGGLVTNALTIVFILAALLVLFFIVIGAFNWITSGGDKEKVGAARKTIVNALIGLALLALAFLIVRVVGQILNIDILNLGNLPRLGPAATGQICPNRQPDGTCP